MLNTKLLGSVSAGPSEFIDDVFSTYLYTGNATARSITNGIDLAGEGGLVWTKSRSLSGSDHYLVDTARGNTRFLNTNSVAAQTNTSDITAFNNDGYSLNADVNGGWNNNGATFCSWTFRKAPKFFDVVTYTGNETNRTIAHNLGSVPGMIIVKSVSAGGYDWHVYHRSLANTEFLSLNTTNAKATGTNRWNSTTPTASVFSLGTDTTVNATGVTFVAYLFAHDAGGFGAAGTDNVISCGSYTGTGAAGNAITLGYEPQYLLLKRTDSIGNWVLIDNMRGFPVGSDDARLQPNLSDAEVTQSSFAPTATGFVSKSATFNGSGHTYIYMAIRRPMKPPTSGTEVFSPVARTGTGAAATISGVGFTPDFVIPKPRNNLGNTAAFDRLRGALRALIPNNTDAEFSATNSLTSFNMDGVSVSSDAENLINANTYTYINYFFRRATGFFDVVCYTGTGSTRTVAHNLGAAPELLICKSRNGGSGREWIIYASGVGNTKALQFNTYAPTTDAGYWNNTTPGSLTFTLGNEPFSNTSGELYVAYLFASVAGVSKVGTYTGNGSSQTINCGFTAGARFVMVKATSTTGDWVVVDTARGLVSGNDPFLELNTTAAEQTGQDILDPDSSGFVVNQTTESINASGVSYIFLAIA